MLRYVDPNSDNQLDDERDGKSDPAVRKWPPIAQMGPTRQIVEIMSTMSLNVLLPAIFCKKMDEFIYHGQADAI